MGNLPKGQWFADCGEVGGWHLRWELGRANVYVPINQWGRMSSASHQYCRLHFDELQRLVNGCPRRIGGSRFGSKRSRERRLLCEMIANYLNVTEVALVIPLPDDQP